jgi:prephenate dehydrogenase
LQIEQLSIFGPGLIGGSIALAAREREICSRVAIWSRDPGEREAARALNLGGPVSEDPAAIMRGASLVILAVPPLATVEIGQRIAPYLEPGAAVSDVASVKAGISRPLSVLFAAGAEGAVSRYAGAHPMAGAERSGLAAARANLFEGSVCFLTPDERTAPDALAAVGDFWRGLGARVRNISPEAHDEAVALISHLPHALAAALARFAGGQPAEGLDCAGPGWRDMTRLAAGSPDLWTEILSRNREPVSMALDGLIDELRGLRQHLRPGREAELREYLAEAESRRAGLAKGNGSADEVSGSKQEEKTCA